MVRRKRPKVDRNTPVNLEGGSATYMGDGYVAFQQLDEDHYRIEEDQKIFDFQTVVIGEADLRRMLAMSLCEAA